MQDLLLRKSIVRWWPWPYWPTFEKIEEVSIKLLLMHADEMGIDWQISQFLQDGNFGWWDCRGLEAVTMRGGGGGEEGVLWASMQHALWGCRIKKTSTSILNDNIVNKTWNSRIHSLTVVHKSGKWLSFDCHPSSSIFHDKHCNVQQTLTSLHHISDCSQYKQ